MLNGRILYLVAHDIPPIHSSLAVWCSNLRGAEKQTDFLAQIECQPSIIRNAAKEMTELG